MGNPFVFSKLAYIVKVNNSFVVKHLLHFKMIIFLCFSYSYLCLLIIYIKNVVNSVVKFTTK